MTERSVSAPLPVDPSIGLAARDGITRISLSSDPHWGSDAANRIARSDIISGVAASLPRRDAFFILGDNVEQGFFGASWREETLELRNVLGTIPVFSLLGNHDARINGRLHFLGYFPRKPADSKSPFYFSFDAGNAVIVVLHLLRGSETFGAWQKAWLEKTLAAIPDGKQVIALSHCFFYSSGYIDRITGMPWYDNSGTIQDVSPILERYGVDLVVSGHNHYMEYLEQNGVRYAVIGAMGGKPDPVPTHVSPASRWFKSGIHGWLDLDIDLNGITLTFRDQNGKAVHEAFIPAEAKRGNTEFKR